jgi:hypothetical protein
VGLLELPTENVPQGGFALVPCACSAEDGELEVYVEERFLAPPYLRGDNLIFNIEGYGRFRLWLRR